jgi:hypothetical protein
MKVGKIGTTNISLNSSTRKEAREGLFFNACGAFMAEIEGIEKWDFGKKENMIISKITQMLVGKKLKNRMA